VFELIVRIVRARLCEGKAQKERPIGQAGKIGKIGENHVGSTTAKAAPS